MTVVSNPVSAPTDSVSETITRLRSLTQTSIQASWRYCDEDLSIAQATQPEPWQTWAIADLNARDHVAWSRGQKVRWLGQVIKVPHDLQGYPLQGLCLRVALTWWAEVAQIFVNGQLVQEGDLFDCATRLLLSPAVTPGEEIAIALRLISPGHDDGALVKSLCLYEAPTPDYPLEPSFIADELAVLQTYLQTFAPEKLPLLTEAISHIDWSLLIPLPIPPSPHPPHPTPHTPHPFTHTLAQLRDRLLPLSPLIKQRQIWLLGHAHLDMAWLWTVAETWKAAERTFESVLALQKDFPELVFCHSTPALYDWMEQNRPDLFKRIQQQVNAGKWEPIGGLWVEPELNIISGESIVRHILYGQRYFQEKFGSISAIAWLPDSFGFTWQLPQLLKQGGIDYFVTQKLRWNDTTQFPYELFQWQAPDGTQILSLMSAPIGEGIDPVKMATYACDWEAKTGIPSALWLPGVGDHGGGPTRDMLELARRWQQSPFFPQLEFTSGLEYLQYLEQESEIRSWESGVRSQESGVGSQESEIRSQESGVESINSGSDSHLSSSEPETLSLELETSSSDLEASSLELKTPTSKLETSSLELQLPTSELQLSSSELKTSSSDLEASTSKPELLPLELETPTSKPETSNSELSSAAARSATQNSKLKTQNSPSLPLWNSDLYLEFHRGCYTTHADQKQINRRCEELLYQAELWASLATISAGIEYPKTELEAAWKKVLFNQFHDILPGSSIAEVFADANQAWREASQLIREIMKRSLDTLTSQISLLTPPHPAARAIVVFNPCSWERSTIIDSSILVEKVADAEALMAFEEYRENGFYVWQICDLDSQEVEAPYCLLVKPINRSYCWELTFLAEKIPALGYRCFWIYPRPDLPSLKPLEEDPVLENECLRVVVDRTTGNLSSIFDKLNQREILRGAGNQLQAFRDEGQYWDAWNIDPNYEEKPLPPAEVLKVERSKDNLQQNNSLISSVTVRRKIGQSVFDQNYVLEKGSPILKIQTFVRNWQERHTLVKVAFPLNLEADFATYELPCGVIERTTKPESDREKAQWEVPAMHWADLSDGNYGVSLLNDCKYGYDAQPNQIRLTLLRGSEFPDPEADKGQHSFTYAIYPHAGDWKAAQTVQKGYELNMPLQVVMLDPKEKVAIAKTLPPVAQLLNLGAENLVLMSFKQSEANPDDYILRCYECHGETAELNLQSDLNLSLQHPVDLLERPTADHTVKGQTATVHPWKIASFKVMHDKK